MHTAVMPIINKEAMRMWVTSEWLAQWEDDWTFLDVKLREEYLIPPETELVKEFDQRTETYNIEAHWWSVTFPEPAYKLTHDEESRHDNRPL